jgi:hypothetical protein
MKNYNEVFKELKLYFSNNINSFKKEIHKRLESFEKTTTYFQKKIETNYNNRFLELDKFIINQKNIIENLIQENEILKTDLNILKDSLTTDKKIFITEIKNSLKEDDKFIEVLSNKTIDKLGV